MVTSDRGLLDVERFDLEPDRPLFHGLVGDLDSASLRGLGTQDKIPHVLRILGAADLSPRIAASMVEVGRTLSTWPQLGGDVALGAATVAAAVRRWGLGRPLTSGRIRIDLDEDLDALDASLPTEPVADSASGPAEPTEPGPTPLEAAHPATAGVLEAVRAAPSGGNVQPWYVESGPGGIRLLLDPARTTTMDVAHRGSYVALGAALFNARTAAAAAGALGPVALFPDDERPDVVASLRFGAGAETDADADADADPDQRLAARHAGVLARGTNRALGRPQPLGDAVADALRDSAAAESGGLHLVEGGERLRAAGEAIAGADRIRYLTADLHREMFAELVRPGAGPAEEGIDVATLGLGAADLATLDIARRPEVMALLADWGRGAALGDDTRDRVASSSALAVVTVAGSSPSDFVRGGAAAEAVWVEAEAHGLAVHPVSPVFLFAVTPSDLRTLSVRFADDLAELQRSFRVAVGLGETDVVALVLRLSHTDVTPVRSRRRPVGAFHRTA
jgi:hypothetical protein